MSRGCRRVGGAASAAEHRGHQDCEFGPGSALCTEPKPRLPTLTDGRRLWRRGRVERTEPRRLIGRCPAWATVGVRSCRPPLMARRGRLPRSTLPVSVFLIIVRSLLLLPLYHILLHARHIARVDSCRPTPPPLSSSAFIRYDSPLHRCRHSVTPFLTFSRSHCSFACRSFPRRDLMFSRW